MTIDAHATAAPAFLTADGANVTRTLPAASRMALGLLTAYLAVTTIALVPAAMAANAAGFAIAHVAVLLLAIGILVHDRRSGAAAMPAARWLGGIGMWLPLLSMSLLYSELPLIIAGVGRPYSDALVQSWESGLFGSQPAAIFAAMGNVVVSELLHAAYVSYYVMIYLPPAILWWRRDFAGFADTLLALTLGIVVCFTIFAIFPVEGPRYLWPAPAGVSDGPFRSLALRILEAGSSRGTAFPSSHVAIATLQCLAALRWQPRLGRALVPIVVLLALGAIYGGFHYATDAIAGALLGGLLWGLHRAVARRREARRTPVPHTP